MARYEHVRKYIVASVPRDGMVRLAAPAGRKYWSRFLAQSYAKALFNTRLKKGDQVMFKRVSNRYSTTYRPERLVK